MHQLPNVPLGKETNYQAKYNPELLAFIPRALGRDNLSPALPEKFYGYDLWNLYELSWLLPGNKPVMLLGYFINDAGNPYIVESKSLKLYLCSFNNTVFQSNEEACETIIRDLSKGLGGKVQLVTYQPNEIPAFTNLNGTCLDNLTPSCDFAIGPRPELINVNRDKQAAGVYYTDLFRSNCLVTKQPDWGTMVIEYKGPELELTSLLSYLVAYRNHTEFHEHCVERIFADITYAAGPELLRVSGYFLRRGGIDINPTRANFPIEPNNYQRLGRQ